MNKTLKHMLIGFCIMLFAGCDTQMLCNIGKEEIVGDYNIIGIDNKTIHSNIYNSRNCAILDCIAYNNFYNNSLCMV